MSPMRPQVVELMQVVHLISRDLAERHVSQMDETEVAQRFCMYTGMELSAEWRKKQSVPDFSPVFGSATATARSRHSTLSPLADPSEAVRSFLPELEEKTGALGGGGR